MWWLPAIGQILTQNTTNSQIKTILSFLLYQWVKYHHVLPEIWSLSWNLNPEEHLPVNDSLDTYEKLYTSLTDNCFQTNLLLCNIQVVMQEITLNTCFSVCALQQHSNYWTVASLNCRSVVVPCGVPWMNASIKYGVCDMIKWFIDVWEKKTLWGVFLLLVSIYVYLCCSVTTCCILQEFPQTEMIISKKEHADSAYEYLCSKALPPLVVNLENIWKTRGVVFAT